MNDLFYIDISGEGVIGCIASLKNNKSPGLNSIFENSTYPKNWSLGAIIPFHKLGSVNDTNNYQGITSLSILANLSRMLLIKDLCLG